MPLLQPSLTKQGTISTGSSSGKDFYVAQTGELEIDSGVTAPPGSNPYVNILTQPDGVINFGIIGGNPAPQTSISVSATANGDALNVGGDMYATGQVGCGSLQFVLDNANPIYGSATLVNGEVVVNTNQADVSSIMILTRTAVNASTALGELRVRQKNAQNFIVTSATPGTPGTALAGDLSSFDWIIINPAL